MINFQYVVITSNVFTIFLNVQTFALNYIKYEYSNPTINLSN